MRKEQLLKLGMVYAEAGVEAAKKTRPRPVNPIVESVVLYFKGDVQVAARVTIIDKDPVRYEYRMGKLAPSGKDLNQMDCHRGWDELPHGQAMSRFAEELEENHGRTKTVVVRRSVMGQFFVDK